MASSLDAARELGIRDAHGDGMRLLRAENLSEAIGHLHRYPHEIVRESARNDDRDEIRRHAGIANTHALTNLDYDCGQPPNRSNGTPRSGRPTTMPSGNWFTG